MALVRALLCLSGLLMAFATPPAAAGPTAPAIAATAKWTVMVYISGDNNLEDYVVKDIELELAALGSSANVQVVALADRGPGFDTSYGDWQTTKLFHVTQGMKADAASAVADWGERNMGDKQSLIDFVAWTKANYPADHYALYFWGHGWNWHPGYVMEDDTSLDALDYHEIKAAIPALGFIDVVGFDGCNMASIEVLKLWRGHATAVAASQEYVNWNGIEYDVVLSQLAANPNMSADAVAVASAQSAIVQGGERTWAAIAVDSRLDLLLTATDEFAQALNTGLASNRKKYDAAFTATRNMWQSPMDKDLYDMAFEINARVTTPAVKTKAQAVMSALNYSVLWAGHTNAYSDVHGITIYHISKAAEKNSDYTYYRSTLDFALTTKWDEFLDAYAK
jgi:Clostripain family